MVAITGEPTSPSMNYCQLQLQFKLDFSNQLEQYQLSSAQTCIKNHNQVKVTFNTITVPITKIPLLYQMTKLKRI